MDNAQLFKEKQINTTTLNPSSLYHGDSDCEHLAEENPFCAELDTSLNNLDIFKPQTDRTLAELDNELEDLFDIIPGAGLYLLAKLINDQVFAPVETTSGEILIQPLILCAIAEKCFRSTQLLDDAGIRCRYDRSILRDTLLNFSLEPTWYPWISPDDAFNSPQTKVFEEAGKRVTFKYLGGHLVSMKTLSMRGPFFDKKQLPTLEDAVAVCIRALSRFLWHKTGKGIKSLCRKPAHVSIDSHTVRLVFGAYEFSKAELDIGLNISKPRIPWLGKSLDICYLGENLVRFSSPKKPKPAKPYNDQ